MTCKNCNKKNGWSILIKATHACNFDCKYCYDKREREKYGNKKMELSVLKDILDKASNHTTSLQLIWHGGEPTLMGIEWFKKAQELIYSYRDKMQINQSMQSNGYLLNEEWIDFSRDYGVEIGISFDGYTQDVRCSNTQDRLVEVIKLFNKKNVGIGAITVINKKNVQQQIEIYEYIKSLNVSPCFNHLFSSEGTKKFDLEMEANLYATESKKLFKHILYDLDKEAKLERSTLTMFNQVTGNRELVCVYSDCREKWISVNCVGKIYPCDRPLPAKYEIGHIQDYKSIEDIYKSNGHRLYSLEIQKRHMTTCKKCGYFKYCQGGCNANHITGAKNENDLIDEFSCELFRQEFNAMYSILREVDFYKNELSLPFTQKIIERPIITLKEIKEYLQDKGINSELTFNDKGKELFECSEYKIFSIFNPFRESGEKLDLYEMNINFRLSRESDLSELKEERFKYIDYIFKKNIDKIIHILNNK